MIKVVGSVADIVPLPDLNDRVYYRQEKTYSEEQYKKSLDLQREIQKGRLLIVSRTDEKFADFKIPASSDNPPESGDSLVTQLIAGIRGLEKSILRQMAAGDNALMQRLSQRIEGLEKQVKGGSGAGNPDVLEAIQKLEERVEASEGASVLDRLEDIIKNAPRGPVVTAEAVEEQAAQDDVYVPTVTVEDASSHVNLKMRTVEKSSSVDSAAEALKKLKQSKK